MMFTKLMANSHIFGRSSGHEVNSFGRNLIWLWSIAFALLTIWIASRRSEIKRIIEQPGPADERTALLSGEGVEDP
jgi:hypothetical protein